jgi:uncharacterized protein (DUF1778 family)
MSVQDTLKARENTHGDFVINAACSQALKQLLANYGVTQLSDVQAEALDNICQKLSRIVTGNPNHKDNWHDIAGYALLAERLIDGNH